MSYRFEGEDLVFDGWERGIADSPYQIISPSALGPVNQTGTVDLSYGNILGIPGEFSVDYPLVLSTTSGGQSFQTPISTTIKFANGAAQAYYIADYVAGVAGNVQIFKSNQTTPATGVIDWVYEGNVANTSAGLRPSIVFWQNYLLTFVGTKIYFSSNNGATNTDWSASWVITGNSVMAAVNHYAISSKVSDTVYFTNASFIGSIILTPGKAFDPTDATTYTLQFGQVQIPSYDFATTLEEMNGQIFIGGSFNRVYPWDSNNLSGSGVTSLVGLPLFLGSNFVKKMVAVNTNLYIFTGGSTIGGDGNASTGQGRIFISNGSQVDLFKKMPDNLVTLASGGTAYAEPIWQFGDAVYHRNQLFFGAIASTVGGSTISKTGGVWCIDLNSQVLYRVNKSTAVNSESSYATLLGPLSGSSQGVQDATLGGQGLAYYAGFDGLFVNSSTNTLSASARAVTDKVPVGTFLSKKTYEQIELKTAVALASGESIDVVIYSDLDPSGLVVGSMTSADGMSKVFTPLNFQNLQWFQIQATLNPTNTNPTFVRLREIRVR